MPVIRTATENDLPRILELYLQLALPPVEDSNPTRLPLEGIC